MVTRPTLCLTPFHQAEWNHAIEQQVFRGNLSPEEAQTVHEDFERDRKTGFWFEVAFPEKTFELCAQLARQYVSRLGSRTLDTLHVAAALELKVERFWTFDERQAKLARAAGLKVRN